MSMPSIPTSIHIDKELNAAIVGRKIACTSYTTIQKGRYDWFEGAFVRLGELAGEVITYADSHCFLTDGGLRAEYGYNHGDIRFAAEGTVEFAGKVKAVTDVHILVIAFEDGSSLNLRLYGWSNHFRISDASEKIKHSAIDGADSGDFTFEQFSAYLSERGNMNVVECCSTCKGALDVYNPVMSWVLLQARIHPRTKARTLGDEEIRRLYDTASQLMEDYKSGRRTAPYIDLAGKKIAGDNDVVWMNSSMLGEPCPVCGTAIDATPCAGTKMYFCPACQGMPKK